MHPFNFEQLIFPTAVIFLTTLVVSFRVTGYPVISLAAAFTKCGIYFTYFVFLFDGTFTFLDDWTYLEKGKELIADDIGLTNLHENFVQVLALAGGDHFVYYLYNAYAMKLFGADYFAPVGLNIVLTVIIAFLGAVLVRKEFPRLNHKYFYLFLLFHPEILSWSNVMNGKDILVLLLHVVLLFAMAVYFRGNEVKALAMAAPAVAILMFMRFYVPLLFALAFFASTLRIDKKALSHILIAGIVFVLAIISLYDGIPYITDSLKGNLVNPVLGLIRFALTPIPFNTESAYAFLNPAATIHWVLFPALILGMGAVWKRKTVFSRFVIFYGLVFFGLYAVYGELQGPRHRVQMDFAIALFQFYGLCILLRRLFLLQPRVTGFSEQKGAP